MPCPILPLKLGPSHYQSICPSIQLDALRGLRLERKQGSNTGHDNKEGRTDIDGNRCRRVRVCSHDGGHDAHDTIEGDGGSVAGGPVARRQDLRAVCVESAVVDVDCEGDGAAEPNILRVVAHRCVCEEEYHW